MKRNYSYIILSSFQKQLKLRVVIELNVECKSVRGRRSSAVEEVNLDEVGI